MLFPPFPSLFFFSVGGPNTSAVLTDVASCSPERPNFLQKINQSLQVPLKQKRKKAKALQVE